MSTYKDLYIQAKNEYNILKGGETADDLKRTILNQTEKTIVIGHINETIERYTGNDNSITDERKKQIAKGLLIHIKYEYYKLKNRVLRFKNDQVYLGILLKKKLNISEITYI